MSFISENKLNFIYLFSLKFSYFKNEILCMIFSPELELIDIQYAFILELSAPGSL